MIGLKIPLVLAQAGCGAAGGGGDPLFMLGWFAILFALMYFIMIRPQLRKEKERKKMVEEIKSGDRVLFSGGILGTVTNVKDRTLTVKIADNVKIEIARGAVIRPIEKDEQIGEFEGQK